MVRKADEFGCSSSAQQPRGTIVPYCSEDLPCPAYWCRRKARLPVVMLSAGEASPREAQPTMWALATCKRTGVDVGRILVELRSTGQIHDLPLRLRLDDGCATGVTLHPLSSLAALWVTER